MTEKSTSPQDNPLSALEILLQRMDSDPVYAFVYNRFFIHPPDMAKIIIPLKQELIYVYSFRQNKSDIYIADFYTKSALQPVKDDYRKAFEEFATEKQFADIFDSTPEQERVLAQDIVKEDPSLPDLLFCGQFVPAGEQENVVRILTFAVAKHATPKQVYSTMKHFFAA